MDIIFDIDGTLAEMNRERREALAVKDYDRFYADDLILRDKPIEPVINTLRAFQSFDREFGEFGICARIVISTGRPERTRDATRSWIMDHVCLPVPPIYMRKDGDHRPDWQIKEEALMAMRFDGFRPVMAFDDRQQVVDMWRRHGLICAQVAEGKF